MDETLDLRPLAARLPLHRPFTPAIARAAGIERPALARMLRTGLLCRVLRGVYAVAGAPDTGDFRAAAVALATRQEAIAVDRTAAWVHGVPVSVCGVEGLVPLDLAGSPSGPRRGRSGRQLIARDVRSIEGLCVTTPLRTALDVGRLLPPDRALAAMDRLLAGGDFTHTQLVAELARLAGCHGIGQLRSLAVQVDPRSAGAAESVLRRRWLGANLPTATPSLSVAAGHRLVRLALGVGRRQFGAVFSDRVVADDLVALEGAGWWIVVLDERRVLEAEPSSLIRHLEREFHQQLLAQTG